MFRNSNKARATAPGSFRETEDKLRGAINEKFQSDPNNKYAISSYPLDIVPAMPVTAGEIVIEDYDLNKYYKVPFQTDADGNFTLGEKNEVKPIVTYDPVQKGMFVFKDDVKREVTSPVMLPGCADCDFERGEKIFTEEEVSSFCNIYDTYFRLADKMHVFGATGEIIGQSIKNWTLDKEETYTNILGETVTLPKGTWMTTIKITDDTTWQQVENGTLKGCSGTYISRKNADKLLEKLTANKIDFSYDLNVFESAVKRVLIKDLEDPVPVTISLVDRPCVPNAVFTSVKACPTSSKAGRSISNATLDKIQSTYDKITASVDNLKELIDKAKGERPQEKEEIDMNKEELEQLLDEKIVSITEKVEAIEKKLPEETEPIKSDYFSSTKNRRFLKAFFLIS